MLPDFPAVKRGIQVAVARAIRALAKQHPTLGRIREIRVFEGSGTALEESGGTLGSPLERVSLPFDLDPKDVVNRGPQALIEQVPALAGHLVNAQIRLLHQGAIQATDHVGNVVHAHGQPFNQDLYIKLLETVELQFDASGVPSIPELFHPDPTAQASMQQSLEGWLMDPGFVDRVNRTIDKQRQKCKRSAEAGP
jgi:hypothetical protein